MRRCLIVADKILDLIESSQLSEDEIMATIETVRIVAPRWLNMADAECLKDITQDKDTSEVSCKAEVTRAYNE